MSKNSTAIPSFVGVLVLSAVFLLPGATVAQNREDAAVAAIDEVRLELASFPPNILRPTWRVELQRRLDSVAAELGADGACAASDELLAAHERLDDFRAVVRRSLDASRRRIDPQLARLAALDDVGERLLGLRLVILAARDDGLGCGGGATVAVDESLTPQIDALPPFEEGGVERPLATMLSSLGARVDFVANELWLVADGDTATEVADRLGAALVASDASDDGSLHWLLRIDELPESVDVGDLPELLEQLRPGVSDAVAVSSEAARRLLALIADEAASGLQVAVNWVGKPDAIRDGVTFDARSGPRGFNVGAGWSANAFDWLHFNDDFVQGIGVTEAWQLLELAGRLIPDSVPIGIVDQGFVHNDLSPSSVFRSTIPGFGLGSRSPVSDWHGTLTAQAACGLVDNGEGAAGTAGPLGRAINVYSSYDYFLAMAGIRTAIDNGARIVNMSFSADVPSIFDWTVAPFRLFTQELRNVILVASAGNDGPGDVDGANPNTGNVDATECFGFCWESTFHTPCENENVVCVAGLGHNSLARDPFSSWGDDHSLDLRANSTVDVYAPFIGVVDGIDTPTIAETYLGTSHASPYLAGVYGLMMAADPSLRPEDVMVSMVYRTDSDDEAVHHIVDAHASVEAMLPPLLNIIEPADGGGAPLGSEISFAAFQHPAPHGEVVWTSDRDGEIGRGDAITSSSLSLGAHRVTASAGAFSDSVTVNVGSIGILSPMDGARFVTDELAGGEFVVDVTLEGVAFDPEDGSLTGSSLVWTDRVNGGSPVVIATGELATVTLATVDADATSHEITLTATDSDGNQQTATVTVFVTTLF